MKYTVETLAKENPSYFGIVDETDVKIANNLIELIESTRSKETPKAGDYLIYTDKYGDYHRHAHIEYTTENRYGGNVCDNGSCAFIGAKEDKSGIWCQGSGGPWSDVPISEMKYVGEEEKSFWTWGSVGARANGGIYFKAKVSVWEYTDPNPEIEGYTSKDYAKFYVSDSGANTKYTKETGYRYHISNGGCMNCTAFKEKADYDAWLKTFRGVEFDRGERASKIVWAWKEERHGSISPKEFEALELPEDTFLMNGRIRRCKRKYDEETHTVHTYYVWYWETDENEDWRDSAMRQNEIREKYYELPWGTPEYILARKEISA